MESKFEQLLMEVESCKICVDQLPHGVNPVIQIDPQARILIAGQAPGRIVHETGIPFDDASGNRLREWMGVSKEVFYDPRQIAILPMGFCYPGTSKSGDLAPRPECAPAWREKLLKQLPNLALTIVMGQYAQKYHFNHKHRSVTELVESWRDYWPEMIPLPHPSPRNNIWLKKNPWFEEDVLPILKLAIKNKLSPV